MSHYCYLKLKPLKNKIFLNPCYILKLLTINILSHILAKISLKKIGIKSSKIGWFWLLEIILTIIVMRFIEKAIDFAKSLITGNWVPGQIFEGITGILAIIGATIIGIFLLLVYRRKINTEEGDDIQKSTNVSQIEILPIENTNIASVLNKAKEELDLVYSPFTCLVNEHLENIILSRELFNIDKVKILIQDPSYIYYAYEKQKDPSSTSSMTFKSNNNNPIDRYMQSIFSLRTKLKSKEIKNIDIRMIDLPITQSMIIIDPNVGGNNNPNSEMYIEPFLFPIKEEYYRQLELTQILFRVKPNPKIKDSKNDAQVINLFDIEYLNFMNLWHLAVSFDNNYDSKYFLYHY
jgi:hypothetical protein